MHRINDRTVQINFVVATPAAGYSLLFPIIPRHYFLGETNPASQRNLAPLGNGAFAFESLMPLQSMRLVRNPYTFRAPAAIAEIEVLFLPDAQIDLYAFERGLVDAIRLPFPDWARNHTAKELTAAPFPAMYFEFIGFNFTREVFRNLDIRQGIAHAFDACEAVYTLYLHHAARAVAPIHPHSWMFDPGPAGFPHDPNRARQLLRTLHLQSENDEAEVPDDEDIYEEYDEYETAPTLVILVAAESPERVAIAHRLSAGLYEIGHTARVDAVPAEAFLARLAADDFDLYIGWMELSYAPDFAFLFSGERTGGVLFNHDPQLETLFAATRVATTESAFVQALSDLQRAFARNLPVIGLSFRHSAVLTGARVQTGTPPASNSIFVYVNEWKINSN